MKLLVPVPGGMRGERGTGPGDAAHRPAPLLRTVWVIIFLVSCLYRPAAWSAPGDGAGGLSALGVQVRVSSGGRETIFELNDSRAARELYAQLPVDCAVEDYGGVEKIFYPPERLATADTPRADDIRAGTLAYYAPWGNVVIFYGPSAPAAGLYELGTAVSGSGNIESMSGTITIEKVDAR